MPFDARAHVFYKIANAPVLNYPFPHFYLESVFPEDYYRELQAKLPPLDSYVPLSETGTVLPGTYKERFSLDPKKLGEAEPAAPQAAFWDELVQWMEGGDFSRLLLAKFDAAINARFGVGNELLFHDDTRLIRDFTNFAIGPHTDSPRKLVSLLFYLPKDDSLAHLGTSIYEPIEPGFSCPGTQHHDFTDFKRVFTAPFRPNSLLAFFKTDRAFHGVDPIADTEIERNMLLYNIYLDELVHVAPRNRGFRWPWARA
jgi:hypothetical protein